MALSPTFAPEIHSVPDTARWIDELVEADHQRFCVDQGGRIVDGETVLARLGPGHDRLHPEVTVAVDDLDAGQRLRLHRRLLAWTRDWVAQLLTPLRDHGWHNLGPSARGLIYQLEQGLGTALVAGAADQVRQLSPTDRQALARAGVRVGRHVVFSSPLLRPEALRDRLILCQAEMGRGLELLLPNTTSFLPLDEVSDESYAAMGFPVMGGRAIRADLVELVSKRLASGARFAEIAKHLCCHPDEVVPLRRALLPERRASRR